MKDRIADQGIPGRLDELIAMPVRIDNHQYERRLEKGGYKQSPRIAQKDPDAIIVDSTTSRRESKDKRRQRKEGLCFGCGKAGHINANYPNKGKKDKGKTAAAVQKQGPSKGEKKKRATTAVVQEDLEGEDYSLDSENDSNLEV